MEQELRRVINPQLQNMVHRMFIKKPIGLLLVNICCISVIGFYQNLIQPNTVAFITSLYKINQIIKDKEALAYNQLSGESKLIDKELVEQKLLYQYQEFKDVFSKAVSNILLSYQPYNYKIKIELDKENTLNYSPSASNLPINYRPLSSTLLITLIRALLSLAKSLLLHLFSL